jgi:oxaloacetate decarboxylase gamma subunit
MLELLAEGLKIAVLGIGFVYTFLLILIFSTTAMSFLITRLFPESETIATQPSPAATPLTGRPGTLDLFTFAAISAAIHHHRAKRS